MFYVAALTRLPFGQPASPVVLFILFLLAGPAYDRWSRGRVHSVYKWASAPVFLNPRGCEHRRRQRFRGLDRRWNTRRHVSGDG